MFTIIPEGPSDLSTSETIKGGGIIAKMKVAGIHRRFQAEKKQPNALENAINELRSMGDSIIPILLKDLSNVNLTDLAFNALLKIVHESDPSTRKIALQSLGRLLKDPTPIARGQAARILMHYPENAAAHISDLIEMVKASNDRQWDDCAFFALAVAGPAARSALPLIINAVGSTTRSTTVEHGKKVDAAEYALKQLAQVADLPMLKEQIFAEKDREIFDQKFSAFCRLCAGFNRHEEIEEIIKKSANARHLKALSVISIQQDIQQYIVQNVINARSRDELSLIEDIFPLLPNNVLYAVGEKIGNWTRISMDGDRRKTTLDFLRTNCQDSLRRKQELGGCFDYEQAVFRLVGRKFVEKARPITYSELTDLLPPYLNVSDVVLLHQGTVFRGNSEAFSYTPNEDFSAWNSDHYILPSYALLEMAERLEL